MPPPLLGRHDADHPAVATAPKSVRRSFACGTEPTDECGSVAPAPCEGELSAAPSWARGSSSRDELMFGGVQLVLGRVEKCCLFAMGGNLEPPPPVQHDAHAHRGSDHDHGRGRPPVRDQGCQDGNAHAGKDRMPLDARSPRHVVTLIAVEHRRLTQRIRFGNRHSVQKLVPEAKSRTMSSSLPRPIQSRSTSLRGGIRRREDAAGGDEVAGYLCHRLVAVVGHLGEHMQSGVVVNTEVLHQDALGLSDEIAQGEALGELAVAADGVERDGNVEGEDLAELDAATGEGVRGIGV
jgi:hypothetical protein